MTIVRKEEIRLLNAHGPYEHGIWSDTNFTKESLQDKAGTLLFFSRSFDLVERIASELLSLYTIEQLSEMTILDIGCYDAWILHQLNRKFNFKRAVGVEPREKNIKKGMYARKFYGVKCSIEIFQGTIDSAIKVLNGENFDIVLCLGTLHHVESTPDSVAKLASLSSNLLILDSMVIERPKHDENSILTLLNLKDIVYLNEEADWSIAAFKFESPYLDGSTAVANIVNVPEERLIKMALKRSSFQIISTSSPDQSFYNKRYQNLRGVKETFIVAKKLSDSVLPTGEWWQEKARLHERNNVFEVLDLGVLLLWLKKLNFGEDLDYLQKLTLPNEFKVRFRSRVLFYCSIDPSGKLQKRLLMLFKLPTAQRELLVNLSRNPIDKIRLEVGKSLLQNGHYLPTLSVLAKILDRDGADWRSFYRATFLSNLASINLGNLSDQDYFENLLRISNPEWPITNQEGLDWLEN